MLLGLSLFNNPRKRGFLLPFLSLAILFDEDISHSFKEGCSKTVENADDLSEVCVTSTLHHSKSPFAMSLSSSSKLLLCLANKDAGVGIIGFGMGRVYRTVVV